MPKFHTLGWVILIQLIESFYSLLCENSGEMKFTYFIYATLFLIGCSTNYDLDETLIEEFELTSQFEESTFEISVGLPAEYNANSSDFGYVIVLDGDVCFQPTLFHAEQISQLKNKESIIVVGIMNFSSEGRKYNYTPPELDGEGGGGNDKFLQFITEQLIPELESRYRISSDRRKKSIMGHSLGGLTSAVAFVDFNDHFGNYFLLSPSLWWDDQTIFQRESNKRNEIMDREQLLFISYGEMEGIIMGLPTKAFEERITEFYSNTIYDRNVVENENHASSKESSTIASLEFYFDNQ